MGVPGTAPHDKHVEKWAASHIRVAHGFLIEEKDYRHTIWATESSTCEVLWQEVWLYLSSKGLTAMVDCPR